MTDKPAGQNLSDKNLFLVRLALGLAQGLLLYLLYHAQEAKIWPATSGLVFAPLLLSGLFMPLLLNQAIGEMRWRAALLWGLAAAILLVLLSIYDVWSGWPVDWRQMPRGEPYAYPHILPSPRLFIFCAAGLFIAHALVVGAQIDRRFQASYVTHFDTAWKMAVQLVLATAFVGAFWLLLWLGAGMFSLIKLNFLEKLLGHEWFSIPVIAMAVAGALHLTDVRPALVRGVRTLGLTLLSWLLPLITLITVGFLASLPFTGLAPLWAVGHASAILLTTAAVMVILINAARQDGAAEHLPPAILRWSGSVAAVLTVPLAAIAIYALYLRVQQYGWTEDRVGMAAALLVAGCHALGYARAALLDGRSGSRQRSWLAGIENWNFRVALLSLTVMIALSTPLASPARIAVADQVARLQSGKVKPEAFDFAYLRWGGGRYGRAALTTLAQSKTATIREAAADALKQTNRYDLQPAAPQTLAQRLTLYPTGQKLPQGFAEDLAKDTAGPTPACLQMRALEPHCDMILRDFDGDGAQDAMVIENTSATLYRRDAANVWRRGGGFELPANCPAVITRLQKGDYRLTPDPHPASLIVIGGLQFQPRETRPDAPPCPK